MIQEAQLRVDEAEKQLAQAKAELEAINRRALLTIADVNQRVSHLYNIAKDYEAAHAEEDCIWAEVLQAIAEGHSEPRGLAMAALRSQTIIFERYCS